MRKSLNVSQAKLLASFCADIAKGMLLAGLAIPIVSKEILVYKTMFVLVDIVVAILLLNFSLDVLKGVKE